MIVNRITDARDPRLADYVDLADPEARRRRERDEIFVAEGSIAVEKLVDSAHRVRSILVTPQHLHRVEAFAATVDAPVHVAPEDVIVATVGFNFHRGVVAAADRGPLPPVADVLGRATRLAVLEGLNDPENLGLIARSARAFGVDGLLLDPTCIDPYYRRTVRVSMGEVLLLDVARFDRWPDGLGAVCEAGFDSWALTPDVDAESIWNAEVPEKLALLLGAEGPGLSDAALATATRRMRIPIDPAVDSLNVGHAAAVAFAVTTRRSDHPRRG